MNGTMTGIIALILVVKYTGSCIYKVLEIHKSIYVIEMIYPGKLEQHIFPVPAFITIISQNKSGVNDR